MVKSSRIGRRIPPSVFGALDNDLTALNMNVFLDEETEDVVVSSVYSFYYNRDTTDSIQTVVIWKSIVLKAWLGAVSWLQEAGNESL